MSFKKSVSVLLLASQISFTSGAFAGDAQAQSPEFQLVQNMIALQGEKLSDQVRNAQLTQILGTYLTAAPSDGREARLQTALVQLGVYTPAQAQAFMSDAKASDEKVRQAQAQSPDSSQGISVMQAEVTKLAQMHPMGAQFSICDIGPITGAVTAMAGAFAATAGLIFFYDNPTCSANAIGTVTNCGYNPENQYTCAGGTLYGPVTCSKAGYYPHRDLGTGLIIGGGIAVALGVVAQFMSVQNCN